MDHMPSSSWDTHVHVFDPVRHPYITNTRYSPPARSTADLVAATPTQNFVIVMSGPEGTNTELTIEAMQKLRDVGREARGVVVMDMEQMTPDELQRLNRAGVRSVRFNTRREGTSLDKLYAECAERIHSAGLRWSIEAAIFEVKLWHSLIETFRLLHKKYGTVFVADHVFAAQPSDLSSSEFLDLLELVEEGILMVKISGLTRYGRSPESLRPLIKEILKRRDGKGGVWGSDWPHVNSTPGATNFLEVNLGQHLGLLKSICAELGGDRWEKLMGQNAAALYE